MAAPSPEARELAAAIREALAVPSADSPRHVRRPPEHGGAVVKARVQGLMLGAACWAVLLPLAVYRGLL